MLRSLSIRNYVVVEALDLEFGPGFTVITGETGAGKSLLLDALDLLLGERFDPASIRCGCERAELAAEFSVAAVPTAQRWLADSDLAGDPGVLLLRRVLDAGGRSRSWVNGSQVTLQQLRDLAQCLVDIHGQHAHQSLLRADAQRELLDAFAGCTGLAADTAAAWQRWRDAGAARERAVRQAATLATERDLVAARHEELRRLALAESEWTELALAQRRLSNAARLLDTADSAHRMLAGDDESLLDRLCEVLSRLRDAASDDPSLAEAAGLLEPAEIQLEEAARFLRGYAARTDLDPRELERVEQRLAAIHDIARKYRVRPEELTALAAATASRLAELEAAASESDHVEAEARARDAYEGVARQLSARRRVAAAELSRKVTAAMQTLAMPGGSFRVALAPTEPGSKGGLERVEFEVGSHPRQTPGPLARVASGGELSRVSLAIQVVASEAAAVPTLVFDEVDVGIGGGVAEVVGRLLQALGERAQVVCVTHLAQVAACADRHVRVVKSASCESIAAAAESLDGKDRVTELARMMGGVEITAATLSHARELLAQGGRGAAPVAPRGSRPRARAAG